MQSHNIKQGQKKPADLFPRARSKPYLAMKANDSCLDGKSMHMQMLSNAKDFRFYLYCREGELRFRMPKQHSALPERQNLHTATFHDMRSYIASIGHMMNLGSDHDIKTKRQNMEMSSPKHKSTGAAKS